MIPNLRVSNLEIHSKITMSKLNFKNKIKSGDYLVERRREIFI